MDLLFSVTEIHEAAQTFLDALKGKKIVAFHGEMGAGKTTFIHAICDLLKVNEAVGSPTFSLINEYSTQEGERFFHLDLYRLCDETEALNAGVEECIYSGNLCFIEWPQKAADLLPDNTIHCYITIEGNNQRMLKII